MRPILFEIPGWDLKVHSYGVLILCACLASLGISVWRPRRAKSIPTSSTKLQPGSSWVASWSARNVRASASGSNPFGR